MQKHARAMPTNKFLTVSVNELEKTTEQAVIGIGKNSGDAREVASIAKYAAFYQLPIIATLCTALARCDTGADGSGIPPLALTEQDANALTITCSCDFRLAAALADILNEYPQHKIVLSNPHAPLVIVAAVARALCTSKQLAPYCVQWQDTKAVCTASDIHYTATKTHHNATQPIICVPISSPSTKENSPYVYDPAKAYANGISASNDHWQQLTAYAHRQLVPAPAKAE